MKRPLAFLATTTIATALLVLAQAGPAAALFEVDCNEGGDTAGLTVASGGDWNGDGIADFAYSLPCSEANGEEQAGRVFIRSGRSKGRILRRFKGNQEFQNFGTSIGWVGDLDGNGKDELAVGSPNFDVIDVSGQLPPDPNGDPRLLILNVGQVRVFSKRRNTPLLDIIGDTEQGELGASIAGTDDMDGDGTPDFVVGATGIRTIRPDARTGGAIFFSGSSGEEISRVTGVKGNENKGLSVANVGRIDADEMTDVLIGSRRTPVGGIRNAGFIEVLAGADLEQQLISRSGTKNELMGQSADADGFGSDFVVGSPGARIDGLRDAGQVTLFSDRGSRILTVSTPNAQRGAEFGKSVAAMGDLNDDGFTDYAAGAPFFSAFVSLEEGFLDDVGQLVVLSGLDGSTIWELFGTRLEENLARSVDSGIDFNDDGIPDLVSGNPGDTARGRRGSGSVRILSGLDGEQLAVFGGRRGLETRIYTASPGAVIGSNVNGYDPDGRLRTPRASVAFSAGLSVAVVDESQSPPVAGFQRIVVGTGHGGVDTRVAVLRAGKREEILDAFDIFDQGQDFGVTVGAGDLANNGAENIVGCQADSETGEVRIRVFRQLEPDATNIGGWLLDNEFFGFIEGDEIDTGVDINPTPAPVNADGANCIVGNLSLQPGKEIAIAPIEGLPAIRIFDRNGVKIIEYMAYDTSVSGVNLATGDLDGDGRDEIITAPFDGPAFIRAFGFNGSSFVPPTADNPVGFLAFDESFQGGAQVGAADVDFDGRDEILVVAGEGGDDMLRAFEADGTPTPGFEPFTVGAGAQIAGTNRFVRQ